MSRASSRSWQKHRNGSISQSVCSARRAKSGGLAAKALSFGRHILGVSGRSWVRAMIVAAVAYVVIGILFSVLSRSAGADHVRLWRLAAWVASAAVAAAHIGYEHYRLGSSPRATALDAAGAVALGAFGLALAANVHWLLAGTHGQRPPLLALPAWPVITAIPAFLGALAVATVLARVSRRVRK